MSTLISDCTDDYKSTGIMLNDFLYEEGKPFLQKCQPGVKKQHTYEELWDMLESIRANSWYMYDSLILERRS